MNPNDIAKAVLERLTRANTPPTPEHYARVYAELSGTPQATAERLLTRLAETAASAKSALAKRLAGELTSGQTDQLVQTFHALSEAAYLTEQWPLKALELIDNVEFPHPDLSRTDKRNFLARLLSLSGEPEQIFKRIDKQLVSWNNGTRPRTDVPNNQPLNISNDLTTQLREALASLLERGVFAMIYTDNSAAEEIQSLATQVRQVNDAVAGAHFVTALHAFVIRLQRDFTDTGEAEIVLRRLINLLLDWMTENLDEDPAINSRIAMLQTLLSASRNRHLIAIAENSLRELIMHPNLQRHSYSNDPNSREAHLEKRLALANKLLRHDPLTGVLNTVGFGEILEREIARARRHQRVLSLILIEVVPVNPLTDTKQRLKLVAKVARILSETIRRGDEISRDAGDRFIIILPETTYDAACLTLNRIVDILNNQLQRDPNLVEWSIKQATVEWQHEEDTAILRNRIFSALHTHSS